MALTMTTLQLKRPAGAIRGRGSGHLDHRDFPTRGTDPKPHGLLEGLKNSYAKQLPEAFILTNNRYLVAAPEHKAGGEMRGLCGEGKGNRLHKQVSRKGLFQGETPWDLREPISQSPKLKRFQKERS